MSSSVFFFLEQSSLIILNKITTENFARCKRIFYWLGECLQTLKGENIDPYEHLNYGRHVTLETIWVRTVSERRVVSIWSSIDHDTYSLSL